MATGAPSQTSTIPYHTAASANTHSVAACETQDTEGRPGTKSLYVLHVPTQKPLGLGFLHAPTMCPTAHHSIRGPYPQKQTCTSDAVVLSRATENTVTETARVNPTHPVPFMTRQADLRLGVAPFHAVTGHPTKKVEPTVTKDVVCACITASIAGMHVCSGRRRCMHPLPHT